MQSDITQDDASQVTDKARRANLEKFPLEASATACAEPPLRVIILTPGVGGQGGISRLMDGICEELHASPDPVISVRSISTRGDVKLLRPLVYLWSVMRVSFACAFGRCDLLHINLASYGSTYRKLVLAGVAIVTNTPYLVHLHGGQYREFWNSRSHLLKRLIDAMFRRASRVVVLGSVWRDLVVEHVPDTSGRITISPNATRAPDLSLRSHKSKAALMILFIGRLNDSKGVHELIQALANIKNLDGWTAVLAGDGEVSQTRAAIREVGLEDRVTVPGWLSSEQISDLWQRGDIFVLPSFVENLPLSILEAFAYGVPVISTPVGSIPEIVENGRTGLIVPTGDSKAVADALARLIRDEKLRASFAAAGQEEFAARFELGGYVRRLTALWIAASGKPRGRPQA